MLTCPKCRNDMEEIVYGQNVYVDRCTNCKGIWFDLGEAESLRGRWMSEVLDEGDENVGVAFNKIKDIDCPRCHKRMELRTDQNNPDLWYEACEEHGVYFDAGEFASSQSDQDRQILSPIIHASSDDRSTSDHGQHYVQSNESNNNRTDGR